MVENKGIVIKHMIRQLCAVVFQRKLSGLVSQDRAVFLVNEKINGILFRMEKQLVIGISRAGDPGRCVQPLRFLQ